MGGGSHCLPGMARKLLGTVPRPNGATSRFLNVKHPRGEVYLFPFEDRFMGNWDLAKEEVSCRTKNDLLLYEAKAIAPGFSSSHGGSIQSPDGKAVLIMTSLPKPKNTFITYVTVAASSFDEYR